MKTKMLIGCLLLLIFMASSREILAKSYWLEGGGVGAGVFALGGGIGMATVCAGFSSGDETRLSACDSWAIPVAIIGSGGIGFGLGAAIGSAFKKKQPSVTTIIDPATGTYGASVGMEF